MMLNLAGPNLGYRDGYSTMVDGGRLDLSIIEDRNAIWYLLKLDFALIFDRRRKCNLSKFLTFFKFWISAQIFQGGFLKNSWKELFFELRLLLRAHECLWMPSDRYWILVVASRWSLVGTSVRKLLAGTSSRRLAEAKDR